MLRPYGCTECGKIKRGTVHFFEEKNPECPVCGHAELEGKVIIHLLIGKKGSYKVACERGQALREEKKGPTYMTSFAPACTCHDCLVAVEHDLGDGPVPTRLPTPTQQEIIE